MAAKEKAVEIDEYFGEVGKRYEMEVDVIRIIPCESQYGTIGLHIMRSKEGHSLKWFSSGEWLKEGETFRVKGTVKAHEEYKGKKQTSLSRVKEIKAPCAEAN
jgi:DNA/RNA endonuclease YhcR with UshA esterase domain